MQSNLAARASALRPPDAKSALFYEDFVQMVVKMEMGACFGGLYAMSDFKASAMLSVGSGAAVGDACRHDGEHHQNREGDAV